LRGRKVTVHDYDLSAWVIEEIEVPVDKHRLAQEVLVLGLDMRPELGYTFVGEA
jgi:hypothetical protein